MTDAPTLLDVLDVRPVPGTADTFSGANLPDWRPRLFGGQVLGQAAVAAGRTVDPDRALHSFHGYFLRPGDPDVAVHLAVERLRDGRSFSARRVQALQDGVPILSGIASFQTAAEGLEHAEAAPDVPDPEDLAPDEEAMGGATPARLLEHLAARPVQIRHVEPPLYLTPDPHPVDRQSVWLRLPLDLPGRDDDQVLHRAALAYASDVTILEPVLRRSGLAWATPGISVASLDHAMWWHHPARADDWLLFVTASPAASGARGLATGRLYDRERRLLATVAQEGMLRLPRP
ncbi:acyl-CoA thioesterase [Kineococcus gynurae]|uniref:Acyl-CoA thioesterase n=1 Tax=Kineococcus gynurae TaxID=452979 RepID=A0ABV5LW44_9ACTN